MARPAALKFLALIFLISSPVLAQNQTVQGIVLQENVLAERILIPALEIPNYRKEMRRIIETLSERAKNLNPEFIITVRDGEALMYKSAWEKKLSDTQFSEKHDAVNRDDAYLALLFGNKPQEEAVGTVKDDYLKSIDGIFFSNLICSENTIKPDIEALISHNNINAFSIERCSRNQTETSYPSSFDSIRVIPKRTPVKNNPDNIFSLKDVKNLLLIKDNSFYKSKEEMLLEFSEVNYDMLIVNPFFRKNHTFNKKEVEALKIKKIGGKRLVLAYFDIAAISQNSYFWKKGWGILNPIWIRMFSPLKNGDFIVEYWTSPWHDLASEYVEGVIKLGFDGIYFEGLDYHYLFEGLTPL